MTHLYVHVFPVCPCTFYPCFNHCCICKVTAVFASAKKKKKKPFDWLLIKIFIRGALTLTQILTLCVDYNNVFCQLCLSKIIKTVFLSFNT